MANTLLRTANDTAWNPTKIPTAAYNSVCTSKVTSRPIRRGPGSSHAISSVLTIKIANPGYRNSQRGLYISRKRRCRHPSRQLRK